MKTEISRNSHQPDKRYTGVYQQQGRMLTDADWNELVDILREHIDDTLKDVVGIKQGSVGGTPRHRALKVLKHSTSDPLLVKPGYVYVEGMAGYIRGTEDIIYDQQIDFPNVPTPSGDYYLYVDLWERTVTHLMDKRLRDKGLHGADTSTRKQMMVQVKWCDVSIDPENGMQNPGIGNADLSLQLIQKNTQVDSCNPCADQVKLDDQIGNYLFRVEIHDIEYDDSNKPNKIVAKWSAENGAVVYPLKFEDGSDIEPPSDFIGDSWVYEFFNEVSEKHLGVHHVSDDNFPQRGTLIHNGYPLTPTGYDYVRRWDGLETFVWDAVEGWKLDATNSKSHGAHLAVDSSSTYADKVLKAEKIAISLQLSNRIKGTEVTSDSLSGSAPFDLLVNGVDIGASGPSAKEKATAINDASAGVHAIAKTVVIADIPKDRGDINVAEFIINGVDIGPIVAGVDSTSQADAIKDAIENKLPNEYSCEIVDDSIVLTVSDGQNVTIQVVNNDVSNRCGFDTGSNTHYGCITVISLDNSEIVIAGNHPEFDGFTAGVSPSVQFVAGDFWLADVRQIEHTTGSVLLDNDKPHGIKHVYLKLGGVDADEMQDNFEQDRKYAFPALTEMTRLFIAGGDGQEIVPGKPLPQPLRVGVSNGEWPVVGAIVRFKIEDGGGSLSVVNGGLTNTQGIAECEWSPDAVIGATCRVKASLVDPDNPEPEDDSTDLSPPVYFYANLITADQVAYASECPDSGANNVHSLLAADPGVPLDIETDGYYSVKEVLNALICSLKADHIPYDELSCINSPSIKTLLAGLDFNSDGHITVGDVLDTLLCKLKAEHVPYDPAPMDAHWEGINNGPERPETVQQAIDDLAENLANRGDGCCTVMIKPGDNIQEAINSLPVEGGCVCLTTGVHEIQETLKIRTSHIKFYGESPDAIVRAMSDLDYLLVVGSFDQTVIDVEVLNIRFEAKMTVESSFLLINCQDVRVAECELKLELNFASIGIEMVNVRNVTVTNNHLQNLVVGIMVYDYQGRLIIENNVIEGVVLEKDSQIFSSLYGIKVIGLSVFPSCYIEHNQINDFNQAILLLGDSTYSRVADNHIERIGESVIDEIPTNIEKLRNYLLNNKYAINIETEHCCVEGNYIAMPDAGWGGVRTIAQHTQIVGNILYSGSKASTGKPVPSSIYCYLDLGEDYSEDARREDAGQVADHSRIYNNKLIGPQTGIIISRVDNVTVEDNFVDGSGAGWFGVRFDGCNDSHVCRNRVEEVLFGIYLSDGDGNHICDNHVSQCGMGILSTSENNLDVSNNTVDACSLTGIGLHVEALVTLNRNRVTNCGYHPKLALGGGIIVFANLVSNYSDALVRIESNEVLDTGIESNAMPDTGIKPLSNSSKKLRAISIAGVCSACQISHNRTGYTSEVLDVQLEHRALLLIAPTIYEMLVVIHPVVSAVVTDNQFYGPGKSYLVELADNTNERFEKIIFNNNICDHLNAEPQVDAATVRLEGKNLIAMGNHIKADKNVNAMSLGQGDRVALIGNITTGDYIQVGTTTPVPITDFNIRI